LHAQTSGPGTPGIRVPRALSCPDRCGGRLSVRVDRLFRAPASLVCASKRNGPGQASGPLRFWEALRCSLPPASRLRAKQDAPETKSFAFAASLSHCCARVKPHLHGGTGPLSESVERQAAQEQGTNISAALIAAVVIWNSLLLVAAITLIVRRRQL